MVHMINAAFVGAETHMADTHILNMAVAAPIHLASVSLHDADWGRALAEQDIVLFSGQWDFDNLLSTVAMVRARTKAALVSVGTELSEVDLVTLLDAGVDDVVPAPVDPVELGARIRNVLRRTMEGVDMSPVEWIGRHLVSFLDQRLWDAETARRVHLSPTQWRVLVALLRRPNQTVDVRQIQTEIWGEATEGRQSYVRQYIVQLRRKLEEDPRRPRHLLTDIGHGYRYER